VKKQKRMVAGASFLGVATLVVAGWAGVSAAVSGGGYSQNQQDCPPNSDAWNAPANQTDPGCHNVAVNVEGGGTSQGNASDSNTRFVEWGNNEVPIDPNSQGTPTILSIGYPGSTGDPHSGCLAANTDGTGGGTGANNGTGCGNNSAGDGFEANYDYYAIYCPLVQAVQPCEDTNTPVNSYTLDTGGQSALDTILTQGLVVYFGQNDNTDNGEHDGYTGVDGTPDCSNQNGTRPMDCNSGRAVSGPSDGGGMTLSIAPLAPWATPTATHPEGAANYSEGFCADGICSDATTQQQTVYNGCSSGTHADCAPNTPPSGDVFTNSAPSSTQEPNDCSSGDARSEGCSDGSSPDTYVANTPTNMNAEPGIQTYQDPDPQRSPALPFGTPGTYVGTCGVYVNAGSDSVGPGPVSFLSGGNVPDPAPGWVGGAPTDPNC
jgi:hypothetical protein